MMDNGARGLVGRFAQGRVLLVGKYGFGIAAIIQLIMLVKAAERISQM